MKAETPSAKSSVREADNIRARSNSNCVSKNVEVEASKSCLVERLLRKAHFPHSLAISKDLDIISSSSHISSIAPLSNAN